MTDDLITKVTKIIPWEGSEVRVIAEQMTGRGLNTSIRVCVHHRESPDHNWVLLSDRPHPDWASKSVDDYVKHNRFELLQSLSAGKILNQLFYQEILKLVDMIGQPMVYQQDDSDESIRL